MLPFAALTKARHLGWLPAALLVAVSAWEIVTIAGAGGDVPGRADWAAASADLRGRFEPGDLIVIAPGWLDPVGRHHLGDLISIEAAARMDDARYRVLWELSARGARAPETRDRELTETLRFGELSLRRWVREPARVVTDFVDPEVAARATVEGRVRGPRLVSLEEVGFAPRRCVRVIPRPDETVTVSFPGVRLGAELVGHVGLADVFTRRDIRDPARLEVRVDGRAVASVTVGVEDGWVRFAATTEPGIADVELAATAIGPNARDRRVCFAAEARE
jgi:hypothetical protein